MKNAINSAFLVEILGYMHNKSKYGKVFYESLPVAGVSGTVKYLMGGTPLAGKVHAKSGSMERVQNYCGYIQEGNRWYAFSVMVNNFAGPRSTVKLEISRLLNGVMAEENARYPDETEGQGNNAEVQSAQATNATEASEERKETETSETAKP